MDSTIDLEEFTCSSDPIETIGFLKGKKVIFAISRRSPFYHAIKEKYNVHEVKREGDTIYFMIN
ncbi:hypothetical protein GWK48_09255 [Metallosphaera tengchongensis]|uniref:Uncharacterized protein n=1 Tax=Metallosphaera tengchongensis TaxID=1532350 RepID=A0A6N0NY86_9CREN|nr:hypothetical protein [Metallosphaera tengchongensis]QKR00539.1 hypothetical protein GWK48_09255 [Metallosphaera tengchongensis]